jgi:hypothetical protein
LKQFRESGQPACRKQDVSWIAQFETAMEHSFLLVKGGRGLEHHFPHLYSQVGVGEMVVVDVQRETVGLDVVVTTGVVVVVTTGVVVVLVVVLVVVE